MGIGSELIITCSAGFGCLWLGDGTWAFDEDAVDGKMDISGYSLSNVSCDKNIIY